MVFFRMQIEPLQAHCPYRVCLVDAQPSRSGQTAPLRALGSAILVFLAVALNACSSSGSSSAPVEPSILPPESSGGVSGTPDSLLQLEDDPGLLATIPDVVSSEVRADTGLQIVYTRDAQELIAPAALIEAQWVFMQGCVGQQSAAPVVVVRDGPVEPFTASDDVIYNIDGIPVASASLRDVSVVQIRETDFDGSLGSPGFNLRSIMGRMLWLSANLPERDYPFSCARQQPE